MGQRIRRRRRELDLTQAELAGPEYTKSFISQLEGGYADPSLDTLRFLGRRLQMGLSTMAGDAGDQLLATLEGLLAWAQEAMRTRRLDAARRAVTLALEIARQAGADLQTAEASLLLADLDLASGDEGGAAAAVHAAEAIAERFGLRLQTRAALASGRLALHRRDLPTAAATFRRALGRVRKAARHPDLAAQAYLGLASTAILAGDLRQARRRLRSALRIAERSRLQALRVRALVRLALACRLDGSADEALEHLQAARGAIAGDTDHQARFEVEASLGALLLERGAALEAIEPLRLALALSRQEGDQQAERETLLALGRAAQAAGDPGLAAQAASEAAGLAVTGVPGEATPGGTWPVNLLA
ncbi:MAG: hypothetical protein QN187_13075 [Armatimonadota bacterium]|nr:hypothetical protein [Armatimonadota bacterium]MDR7519221.1 hypothetical protein [Armatimonadota bacterium]MDR7550314.1 hypothetical protein [Armatimonadota bacterium]